VRIVQTGDDLADLHCADSTLEETLGRDSNFARVVFYFERIVQMVERATQMDRASA
jgi:hypothetical protein